MSWNIFSAVQDSCLFTITLCLKKPSILIQFYLKSINLWLILKTLKEKLSLLLSKEENYHFLGFNFTLNELVLNIFLKYIIILIHFALYNTHTTIFFRKTFYLFVLWIYKKYYLIQKDSVKTLNQVLYLFFLYHNYKLKAFGWYKKYNIDKNP